MKNLRKQMQVTVLLGILVIFTGVLSHLALTDIYHGGADLTLEWNFLRFSAILFLIFISMTLFTLKNALGEFTL